MKYLKKERPDVYHAFMELAEKIENSNTLPGKTKELVKLASCLTQGSSFGIGLHVRSAFEQGATKDEIIDTIVLCLPTAGISLTNQAFEVAMGTLSLI
ncbi:MAG TPA: hypothetical protein DCE48_05190 [Lachnospiraceae bacterium]|nr:hypothetical protein [Lachnospiraceae bacterium]